MEFALSSGYLQKAGGCLGEAEDALELGNDSICIARSAECVEFALKAAIRRVGGGYKREHDVSGDLVRERNKFPRWFSVKVPRLAAINRSLAFLFPWARYGDELLGAPSEELFTRRDAITWLENAQEVYQACSQLYQEFPGKDKETAGP